MQFCDKSLPCPIHKCNICKSLIVTIEGRKESTSSWKIIKKVTLWLLLYGIPWSSWLYIGFYVHKRWLYIYQMDYILQKVRRIENLYYDWARTDALRSVDMDTHTWIWHDESLMHDKFWNSAHEMLVTWQISEMSSTSSVSAQELIMKHISKWLIFRGFYIFVP